MTLWGRIVQILGFLRKEVVEVIRQPRLLVTLVFGPFLILLLFGVGYNNAPLTLRTLFVGPPGSVYEQVVEQYSGQLAEWVQPQGFTSDLVAAQQELQREAVDLLVVFPDDPVSTVLAGEQAEIRVIHDELDPIQQTAIEFATRLAVDEVNSTILARIVGVGQETTQPLEPVRSALATTSTKLAQAVQSPDGAEVQQLATELGTSAAGATALLDATHGLLSQLDEPAPQERVDGIEEARDTLERIQSMAAEVAGAPGESRPAQVAELADQVAQLDGQLSQIEAVDPAVLVRPFTGTTEVAVPVTVGITDFFAPAAIVLLVQHLGVTFGALTFVRDRMLGLLEVLRVGPVSAFRNLAGKLGAYTLLGSGIAALLAVLVVFGLDVPLVGEAWWVAVVLALVLVASIGLGFVASLMAKSDSQAVQFAMIFLLASLFFGGFFLDLERLTYPVEIVSLVLPVRYGIAALQEVMLRGQAPQDVDLLGLGALAAVSLLGAWALLRRQLRVV